MGNKIEFEIKPLVGTPLDYSDGNNWMFADNNDNIDHDVDVFYLYPTSVSNEVTADICEDLIYMRQEAHVAYLQSADTLSSFANMYAPFYRQISGAGIMKYPDEESLTQGIADNITRTDVYAALDYYFDHYNNGKPYILAGHSQGTACLKIVLSEYMKVHPEYLDRMIACYAIGYYFPNSWFENNPQIKKAAGETDTGVLITWNTEGPNAKEPNLLLGNNDGFCINPLNWRVDETPADISLNKGSLFVADDLAEDVFHIITAAEDSVKKEAAKAPQVLSKEAADSIRNLMVKYTNGVADAVIDKKRGALITTTYNAYIPANPLFGDKSCHFEDWSLFTINIRENAQKRIKAYFNR